MTLDDILIDRYVVVTSTRYPWAYFCRGSIVAFDLDARTVMLFIEKDHGDCEFITFFVHEVELAEDEPLFAEPTDGWVDHKLQDLSTIAHLYPPPPPRRPLSSLSDEEAKEVYRLAFGREPYGGLFGSHDEDEKFEIFDYELEGRRWDITLWEGGRMSATITNHRDTVAPLYQCPPFAAVKVVRYLDSLGIDLGLAGND